MGSCYDLRVGGYSVHSDKWPIEEEILSLFVEADKIHSQSAPDLPNDCVNVHEGEDFLGYCSTVAAISDRLDVMGFTLDVAKAQFGVFLKNEIHEELQLAEAWGNRKGEDGTYSRLHAKAKRGANFLSTLSFEKWVDAVRRIKDEGVRWKSVDSGRLTYGRELDLIEAHVLNGESDRPPLGFYCSDIRFLIRAFLLCAAPTESVVLDCTEMVQAGYFDAACSIAAQARISITAGARAVEKILVLTEGCSDTRLLQETLDVLHPHLREFLSFLDHDQFSVAGGAGNLFNLLRGFAGAGVSNRVLALFDNDTAGSVQFSKAVAMALPENFRVLQLPDLAFAGLYPTLGPTGLIETNINGSACSIELYLGKSALAGQSNGFMPVQWTGYERSLSRYQGELVDKRTVQQRYLEDLHHGCADTTNMELVFRHILRAFHE